MNAWNHTDNTALIHATGTKVLLHRTKRVCEYVCAAGLAFTRHSTGLSIELAPPENKWRYQSLIMLATLLYVLYECKLSETRINQHDLTGMWTVCCTTKIRIDLGAKINWWIRDGGWWQHSMRCISEITNANLSPHDLKLKWLRSIRVQSIKMGLPFNVISICIYSAYDLIETNMLCQN